MLVLARRVNQSIMIGDEIEVIVVDIRGDQVKIGIKAPKHVTVHRAEVHQEIQEENKKAVEIKIAPSDLGKLADILKKKNK